MDLQNRTSQEMSYMFCAKQTFLAYGKLFSVRVKNDKTYFIDGIYRAVKPSAKNSGKDLSCCAIGKLASASQMVGETSHSKVMVLVLILNRVGGVVPW